MNPLRPYGVAVCTPIAGVHGAAPSHHRKRRRRLENELRLMFYGADSAELAKIEASRIAGSVVSSNLMLDKNRVTVVDQQRTLREFVDTTTGSGTPLSRFFCGTCGNPVMSITPTQPGKIIVKMRLFPLIPKPVMENFVAHKHSWEGTYPGVTRYTLRINGEKA